MRYLLRRTQGDEGQLWKLRLILFDPGRSSRFSRLEIHFTYKEIESEASAEDQARKNGGWQGRLVMAGQKGFQSRRKQPHLNDQQDDHHDHRSVDGRQATFLAGQFQVGHISFAGSSSCSRRPIHHRASPKLPWATAGEAAPEERCHHGSRNILRGRGTRAGCAVENSRQHTKDECKQKVLSSRCLPAKAGPLERVISASWSRHLVRAACLGSKQNHSLERHQSRGRFHSKW